MQQYPLSLTRYLYFLDEAIYTLQNCIIKKVDFDEIVWWCGELYYSGFNEELWDLIFSFYYNFKCIIYPKYEKLLCKFHSQFQDDNDIKYILSAVKILYNSKNNFKVFDSFYLNEEPELALMGRYPKILTTLNIEKSYRKLIQAVHTKKYSNILLYFDKKDVNKIYNYIIDYFKTIHKLELSKEDLDDIPYKNKKHILFALIHYLYQDVKVIKKRLQYHEFEYDKYKEILELDNKTVTPAYKTLTKRLRYPISDSIGCFPLNRYKCDYKKYYREHWEYFAYKCMLWKKRFEKYNIIIDDDKKQIIFKNDLDYEEFGENYYFENDEQSIAIQNHSIKEIPKITKTDWKNLILNKLNINKEINIIITHKCPVKNYP